MARTCGQVLWSQPLVFRGPGRFHAAGPLPGASTSTAPANILNRWCASWAHDPVYLGVRHQRIRGLEYQHFIDRFVDAVIRVYPDAVLHGKTS